MVAAALTLWTMFAVWVMCPALGAPRGVARTAAGLLALELVLLLGHSYGCEPSGCGPAAAAMGTAARLDVPLLGASFLLALACAPLVRRA